VVLYRRRTKEDNLEVARAASAVSNVDAELLAAYPALMRRLTVVLRDAIEAEDVAQAAFTRALEHRHTFAGGDVRAWFYTIGLRLAFNELRRRRRLTVSDLGDEPTWAMSSDPDLWTALQQLEPHHRAALLLSTLDGYTHEEIGQMLGVRPGTVSSWLSRSKERLRAFLGGDA
jgi:RNA polymerase sigma-70 factor (ECF subfamily)